MSYEGEASAQMLAFISFGQAPILELSGVLGVVVIDQSEMASLATLTLDSSGKGSQTVLLPLWPSLIGTSIVAQGIATSPWHDPKNESSRFES